jgi:hypothetical protein
VAAVLLATLSVLAGCGGSDDDVATTAGPASTSPASPSAAPETPSGEPAPTAPATPTPAPASPPAVSTPPAAPEPAAGAYISLREYEADPAAYANTDVVLFFHADWCPKCRKAEAQFESEGVPAGLTIVKASFDNDTDLKKRYGVTVQHTYVYVDAAGQQLDKWTGGYDWNDLAEIQDRVA